MKVDAPFSPYARNGHATEEDAMGVHDAIAELQGTAPRPNGRDRRRAFVPRFVPKSLQTGHPLVDQFATLRLQGIMVHRRWMSHPKFCTEIKDENGQLKKSHLVNLVAVLVFADLVDWYRTPKIRVNGEGRSKRKFDEAWLVKSFASWARDLGLSKGQVQDAVYLLKKEGLLDYREASKEVREAWKAGAKSAERPFEVWPIAAAVKKLCEAEDLPTELADNYRTGNPVCDELFALKLRGDVIDFNWLHHPKLRAGAKNQIKVTALFVIAHLFYLHTPFEPTNPVTHEALPMQTKFKNDVLSKDYETWAKLAHLTEDQLRRAVAFLVEVGLILRETGTELTSEGYHSNFRAMITPLFGPIFDLTFGPFPSAGERDRVIRSGGRATARTPKDLPKFAEGHRQLSLEEANSSPVVLSGSPEICRDRLPKFAETDSRNLQTIIEPYQVPFLEQQQQRKKNEAATHFVGGDLDAFASATVETETLLPDSELENRRQMVIKNLLGFETGCASSTIYEAARLRIEHAEMWATWWPHQDEAKDWYWDDYFARTGRRKTPGAALAERLRDIARIPDQVREERTKAKRRADQQERRRATQEAEEAEKREARDASAYQRKMASEMLRRFAGQSEATRLETIVDLQQRSEFLVARSPRRDLRLLVQRAIDGGLDNNEPLLFALCGELSTSLDSVLRERPPLPGLEQRAAGEEEFEENESFWDSEAAAPAPNESMAAAIRAGAPLGTITELVRSVQAGEIQLADLDRHRSNNYNLDEWEAIKERVVAESPRRES